MSTPATIYTLVERFDRNLDNYKRGKYNETQLRREFIDPFFEELGWDIANKKGYAEAYKEVIHEDAIKIGQATKAPDYCFRIGGVRKFFLEAKKPSIDIKDAIHPAYQLRRYAWSAKLPLSILTDFEEFAVYDCRIRPVKTDKASTARIFYLTYTDYAQQWDEIAEIFSQDSILKGSFDRYVESKKVKRGTAEVDTAFLQEIERWREILARNIALRNPRLTQRELNFTIQRTIDRIIFLRISEDRGIEPYGTLMALQNGTMVYKRLFELFYRADDRYNSGLFHFQREKNRSSDSLDTLTSGLTIDDKILKDILRNLYYPDSSYEFSVLPADILGQVYEQFLGKVIRLTPAHRAVVENKPEVKKAGGVYYTPTYIVYYIVQHTVGKLVEGKKPGPRGAVSKLRILDPACGSGSFLLGAYQFLLDWHRDEYIKDGPEKWATGRNPCLYQTGTGEWKLTTDERKRILLNNIYGVDIDSQAVEVTKLSLLLKVLEGEDIQTINRQLTFLHERVLPDLGNNIKCGNSLIGTDFYEGKQMSFLDEEEMYRINAFDWDKEFPEIMKDGGFDAVIGNPPYVVLKGGRYTKFEESKDIISYYKHTYKHLKQQINLFIAFLEKGYQLIGENNYFGMIIPNTLITNDFCGSIRKFFLVNSTILFLNNEGLVFKNSIVEGLVFIYLKSKPVKEHEIVTKYLERINKVKQNNFHYTYNTRYLVHLTNSSFRIIKNCEKNSWALGKICEVWRGLTTGNDAEYLSKEKINKNYKKIVQGKQITRYFIKEKEFYVFYDKSKLDRPRPQRIFEKEEKIISKFVGRDLSFGYDSKRLYVINTACVIFPLLNTLENIKYILGILNSKIINFYFRGMFTDYRSTFPIIKSGYLELLPIHKIDFSNPTDEAQHDRMVSLVERMLDLHKQLSEAQEPQAKTVLKRQIETTDRQIDELVYELYGLTEEEIKIVEDV